MWILDRSVGIKREREREGGEEREGLIKYAIQE